jgi:hypothetical protein
MLATGSPVRGTIIVIDTRNIRGIDKRPALPALHPPRFEPAARLANGEASRAVHSTAPTMNVHRRAIDLARVLFQGD